jgi:hypothetical protein
MRISGLPLPKLPASVLASVLALCAGPAVAHHSFAAVFDADQPIEFTGTVTRVEWLNPHVWFYIDVENSDGTTDNWAFEMGSPNRLQRYGWHQNSLPPGQVISVTGSQARDGSMKAAVETVVLADGRQLFGAQDASQ